MHKRYYAFFAVSLVFLTLGLSVLWANWANDIPICISDSRQDKAQIISDSANNAILVWEDERNGNDDIYIQKIDSAGTVLWMQNGSPVCTDVWGQLNPQLATDGCGGAIIAWQDVRNDPYNDIYVQRIAANGIRKWALDGICICNANYYQADPQIVSNGAGGAIIVWWDGRINNTTYDIYAQKVDSNGIIQWTPEGKAICSDGATQKFPRVTSDGVGGAIIAWEDERNGNSDIFAQRIDADGMLRWSPNGVALCTAAGDQVNAQLTSDGSGGAMIAWLDERNGNKDIFVQGIRANGAVRWIQDGVAVCTAAGYQAYEQIVCDGFGGALVCWQDARGGNPDIYSQRVDSTGSCSWQDNGMPISTTADAQTLPQLVADGRGGAIMVWQDTYSSDIFAQWVYSNGDTMWTKDGLRILGPYEQLNLRATSINPQSVILVWEDTRNSPITTYYDIYAQKLDYFAPIPPRGFAGIPIYYSDALIGLLMSWNENPEHDVSHYRIYKSSAENFLPGPDSFLGSTSDTYFYDMGWRWMPYVYYKLTAVDSAGHESTYSTLTYDDIYTGLDTPRLASCLRLEQNHPNPFNPSTTIRYYLPDQLPTRLEIYDVAGRRIVCLIDKMQGRGSYRAEWNGKDRLGNSVASGIYFCRLSAGRETLSRKMVLLK